MCRAGCDAAMHSIFAPSPADDASTATVSAPLGIACCPCRSSCQICSLGFNRVDRARHGTGAGEAPRTTWRRPHLPKVEGSHAFEVPQEVDVGDPTIKRGLLVMSQVYV